MKMVYQESSRFTPLTPASIKRQPNDDQNKAASRSSLSEYDLIPLAASALRVNGYCMIDGYPSKITEYNWIKTGKHGIQKYRTVGVGLFDGRTRHTVFLGNEDVLVPIVEKRSNIIATIDYPNWIKIERDMNTIETTLAFPKMIAVTESMTALLQDTDLNFLLKKKNQKSEVYVDLTFVVCCKHFFISRCNVMTDERNAGEDTGEK